jgi:hypothetical protein
MNVGCHQVPGPIMIFARIFLGFTLSCVLALAAMAGPPTLTFPKSNAIDQPSDLTLAWEAGTLTNYVKNGSFERGFENWFGSINFAWQLGKVPNQIEPVDGKSFAQLHLTRTPGVPNESPLSQAIKLPKKGSSALLSWSDITFGALVAPGGDLDDRIHWSVEAPSDGAPPVFEITAGQNGGPGWQRHEVDISSLLGKSFEVTFNMTNGVRSVAGVAFLDDVRIEVTPEFVEYEVYSGLTANLGAAQLLGKTTDVYWSLSGLAVGSTNYWKVIQITDGVRESSPVFQFVVGGSVPVEAPLLLAGLNGGQLRLHALTQAGGFYLFEQADAPDSNTWQPIGDEIAGDGTEAAVDVPLDAEAQFFRIRVTR